MVINTNGLSNHFIYKTNPKKQRTENVNLWIPFMHFPHGGTYGETKGSDRCRLKIIDQEKMFKVHHNT